jgi:UDP-3-O-[3-hydroxymyristoyl] N-acetylglucosamine deacetylase
MMVQSRTLRNAVSLRGRAGLLDSPATIHLIPAEPGRGLVMRRRGASCRLSAEALTTDVPFQHTTCIATANGPIFTTEHLLAAVVGFQITDLLIEVEAHGHIPFFDGSACEFANAIQEVGLEDGLAECPVLAIRTSSVVCMGSSVATLAPSADGALLIEAQISFPQPIGEQSFSYKNSPLSFGLRLAHARTFMGKPWHGQSLSHFPGFYHRVGATRETNMVTHDGEAYNTDLRMHDEPVRHKVLDALGDFGVLGVPLVGHLKLFRPGHALNREIVRKIVVESERREAICA